MLSTDLRESIPRSFVDVLAIRVACGVFRGAAWVTPSEMLKQKDTGHDL
jgi:hypothetical protein